MALVRLRAMWMPSGFLGVHFSLTASLGKVSAAWEPHSINKEAETRGIRPNAAQERVAELWVRAVAGVWPSASSLQAPEGLLSTNTQLSVPRSFPLHAGMYWMVITLHIALLNAFHLHNQIDALIYYLASVTAVFKHLFLKLNNVCLLGHIMFCHRWKLGYL